MTTFETPKTPRDFAEAMLRSSLDADRLVQENINDRWLREAHTHTAVNGLVAALAMETLRRHASPAAEELAETLDCILTAGDLGGPAWRTANALGFNPDQWETEFAERATTRAAKPETGRRATHVALTDLAERWDRMGADDPDFGTDLFVDPPTPVELQQHERAAVYRRAAADLRETLRTGHIPHDLMTDAELEQHGAPAVD